MTDTSLGKFRRTLGSVIRPSSTGWWLPVAAGLTGYIDDGSIVAISIGLVAVSTWMIVIGASGFRLLSIIFVSFVVISGTIGVKWGMDTTGGRSPS